MKQDGMSNRIKHVVVVGGGTAGWLCAARIAAEHRCDDINTVKVTLVESPNTPTVGVGEGTWPTLRATLKRIGIAEAEFITCCDASFKQGAKFINWLHGDGEFYYHPLMVPQDFNEADLAAHWCNGDLGVDQSFSNTVCFQESLCESGRAPKRIASAEYAAVANYSYHLDAAKFAKLLAKHAVEKLGVEHILADVESLNTHACGDIKSLNLAGFPSLSGDLFVDCTGFSSLLLSKHYCIGFNDCSDVLFIDNALAVQVPYEHCDQAIASHTVSTAQEAGWIWDIGLRSRRGVGYVFSERHCSREQAYKTLANYLGPHYSKLPVKHIPIRSGYREKFWHKNCVAVGLSAGFLEPLEASAIVLVELSAAMIAEQMPQNRALMDIVAERFNETFRYRWQRIIDFLKLHYCLSQRPEPFWRDNRAMASWPVSLKKHLALWRFRPPTDNDFVSNNEVFPAASYQYVLYGMGFKSDVSASPHLLKHPKAAQAAYEKNRKARQLGPKTMPLHRELIDKIHQYGIEAM